MENNGIEIAGFWISKDVQTSLVTVFVLYTVIILALGFYVKYQSRKEVDSEFSKFITGGGNLNTFQLAMVTATSAMAGGTMVSGPGLTYKVGFIYTLVCYSNFIQNYVTFGTFGKKFSIMKQRLHADTIVQLIHHRFQSKRIVVVLSLCSAVFGVIALSGQFVSAAKIFSAILGSGVYKMGLILSVVLVVAYSLSGGVKSMTKICIVQGVVMCAAVALMVISEFKAISAEYGNIQAAMEFVQRNNEALVNARTFSPLYAVGMCLVTGWGNTGGVGLLQTTMMYDKTKTMQRAAILGGVMMLFINGIMASSGPIAYSLNQNITNADYEFLYLSTSYLPGVLSGVIITGVMAAIQSTVATGLISTAGVLAGDMYKRCINPDTDDKKLQKINIGICVLIGLLSLILALNPSELAQMILILGVGGSAIGFIIPVFFGAYWKKTTEKGAFASIILGLLTYASFYILSSNTFIADWYATYLGGVHPIIPAMIVSVASIVWVSLATQNKKVPLGIYKVWFCKDYEERFALMYDADRVRK